MIVVFFLRMRILYIMIFVQQSEGKQQHAHTMKSIPMLLMYTLYFSNFTSTKDELLRIFFSAQRNKMFYQRYLLLPTSPFTVLQDSSFKYDLL